VAHEVVEVLSFNARLAAYSAIMSVPLPAPQPAQVMPRVGAGVSGLGLETAPVAAPTLMQPLPQRVDRLGHKTPPMPQLFFVVIAFLQKNHYDTNSLGSWVM
jgi:hypothetical protein